MKKCMLLPCLLLATFVAAQSTSPADVPQQPAAADAVQSTDIPPAAATPVSSALPVPAGTALMVRLDTTLATFSNKAGDPFQGHVTTPIIVNGTTVIPAGAMIEGRVTKVTEPRRIAGRPSIGILPETVILPTGQRYYLDATLTDTNIPGTDVNSEGQFKGSGHDRRDQLEVGGGAAGGMVIGGLVGGPVGVLVGGTIGAGATTGHWLAQHRSATLPAGTQLTLELNRPLAMSASTASGGSK